MKKDVIVCNVIATTDYSRFKYLQGNRKINLHNLRRIKESMSKGQLISVIIVNENFEIIDGQHRFESCKSLNIPVYYVICKDYGLREVQILNTNASCWTKKEYLNSYCDLGCSEYIRFREFMELFPSFSLTTCYNLLSGIRTAGGVQKGKRVTIKGKKIFSSEKVFENGDFKVKDWDFAVKSAEKIMMIKPYYDGFHRKSFVLAMVDLFKTNIFNHAEFISKVSYQAVKLVDCTSAEQYKILIEEIYNYRRSKKVNLRFAS